jgi:hypothetical protein
LIGAKLRESFLDGYDCCCRCFGADRERRGSNKFDPSVGAIKKSRDMLVEFARAFYQPIRAGDD